MRFLIFVLPLVSGYIDFDGILEHVEKKVDKSVKPCDDFYRHVCSNELSGDDFLFDNLSKWFRKVIEPYNPLANVISAHSAESNRVRRNMHEFEFDEHLSMRCFFDPTEFERYYNLFPSLEPFTNCFLSIEVLLEKIYSDSYTEFVRSEVKKRQEKLRSQSITTLAAWYNYIGDEKNGFAEKEERGKQMFMLIKDTMLAQLQNSTWVKKHKLEKHISDVMDQTHYHSFKRNPLIEHVFEDFEKMYNECTNDWITGYFGLEYDLCLWKSVETTSHKLGESLLDRSERTFISWGISAVNAGYFEVGKVIVFPSLYGVLDSQDEMHVLTSFGHLVAHEVGHAIFGSSHFTKSEAPLDLECMQREMNQTCKLFAEEWKCHSGTNTLREDAADFAARTTTLELAKKLVQQTNKTNVQSTVSPTQQFFYGIATTWCNSLKQNDPTSIHSAPIVRINGVLRQSEEFRKAFECKAGDDMVMTEDKRCHLFGKFAQI